MHNQKQKKDDQELLKLAESVILNSPYNLSSSNIWNDLRSGVFVTTYKEHPMTSENVWCCMSNGEYGTKNSVAFNTVKSATICRSEDDRRTNINPTVFEITILADKSKWRIVEVDQLDRLKQKAICVQTKVGKAIYLGSVWNERPEWSANDVIKNLTAKAERHYKAHYTEKPIIYEIDTYDITKGTSRNHGYFDEKVFKGGLRATHYQVSDEILKDVFYFYNKFAESKYGGLAYLIKYKNGIQNISYDNQGAMVRTLADLTAYNKLAHKFNDENAKLRVAKEIERLFPIIKSNNTDTADIAGFIELLLSANAPHDVVCTLGNILINRFDGKKFSKELSFENPQAMLALINLNKRFGCYKTKDIKKIFYNFFKTYNAKTVTDIFGDDDGQSFGVNWVVQALSAGNKIFQMKSVDIYINKIVSILFQAVVNKRSITQEATALHGLLSYFGKSNEIVNSLLDESIQRWRKLQKKWRNNGFGGFRYYENEMWYRTDVTSHIVEVILF